jgi:hypothetical protein
VAGLLAGLLAGLSALFLPGWRLENGDYSGIFI